MTYWYYFDANNERQGPVDDETLVLMAQKRLILPETPMESDDGHRGKAGQIPGLFAILAEEAANRPVKKRWYCGHCGGPVPKRETVCLRCGARPDGSRRFCRRCGGPLRNEQIVCLRCGAKIEPVETGSGSNVPAVFMYLVAFFLYNVFLLFIIWSASKDKNPKVNRHGKNILN